MGVMENGFFFISEEGTKSQDLTGGRSRQNVEIALVTLGAGSGAETELIATKIPAKLTISEHGKFEVTAGVGSKYYTFRPHRADFFEPQYATIQQMSREGRVKLP